LGDGILVYFGYPHAREDDAELGRFAAPQKLGRAGPQAEVWFARHIRWVVGSVSPARKTYNARFKKIGSPRLLA
jgi:hypothetical protein